MQALRNTFLTSRRTAARRPHVVTTLETVDAIDRRMTARPEEAVIDGQVFPAIAQLPEPFRLALVAVDIAGLTHREAAGAFGREAGDHHDAGVPRPSTGGARASTPAIERWVMKGVFDAGHDSRAASVLCAPDWSRCGSSWWRDLTPSLRNALRRW